MNEQLMFKPPAKIGLLGGGQLGRMIGLKAREFGYTLNVLDPTPNSPTGQIADEEIVADFSDVAAARKLAQKSDVITYEFENIGANIADYLEKESHLPQGYSLLYTIQNRLREKRAVEEAGVKVVPYYPVDSPKTLHRAVEQLGLPIVLKTTEGGYDGKGQFVIKTVKDLEDAISIFNNSQSVQWVAEKFVSFVKELSIIVARNYQGEIKTFPIGENIHQNNILHVTIAPARVGKTIQNNAYCLGKKLAKHFSLIGLLAIELFLLEDGSLYVNELAPRPHNSGHYTQQACVTSQFEQHIRAVCNLPLADTSIVQSTVMVNILGKHLKKVLSYYPYFDGSFKVHLYGKSSVSENRKMGHVNVIGQTDIALKQISDTQIWNIGGILSE